MKYILAATFAISAATVIYADDTPKFSGKLDGKSMKFSEKTIADGVKATIALLESCHDESLFGDDEFTKAQKGDHIRLVFAKAVKVSVLNEKFEITELWFRRPLNTGVFWVRVGDKWKRFTKYEHQKTIPFENWLQLALPAE